MCTDVVFRIPRGSTFTLPFTFKGKWWSYELVITPPTIFPTAGALYTNGTNIFTVTSTDVPNNKVYIFDSQTSQSIFANGILTKISGTGDANITYTNFLAYNEIDITSNDILWRILTVQVDTPSISEIIGSGTIVSSSHLLPKKGKTVLSVPAVTTATWAVGEYFLTFQLNNTSLSTFTELTKNESIKISVEENKVV